MLQARRLEVDHALNEQVLSVLLRAGLLLDAVHEVLEDKLKELLCEWVAEESLEVQVKGPADFDGVKLCLRNVALGPALEHVEQRLSLLLQGEAIRYRVVLQDSISNPQKCELL